MNVRGVSISQFAWGGCMNDARGDDTILDCERLKKQFQNMLFYKLEHGENSVNTRNEGRR